MAMDMERIYTLRYDAPAPQTGIGFESLSLPIGNGYMGINIFGGTEQELLSVAENSMHNPPNWKPSPEYGPEGDKRMKEHNDGLNTLSKVYLDFAHPWSQVTNYRRELRLNDAVASVAYEYAGVEYLREYFCSYPDKVAVLRLTASQPGKLSFTLRPTAPYVRSYVTYPDDGKGKTGTVTANGDTITVAGTMQYFHINYEGLFRVIPTGGRLCTSADSIRAENADSAVILIAVGTNYHMAPEVFLADDGKKLNPLEFPHDKVTQILDTAAQKSWQQLKDTHLADHRGYFSRVNVQFSQGDTGETTHRLLEKYIAGDCNPYLEELVFHYGRYLLIASMRSGCLPANLQGVWNFYESVCCGAGYWHNINIQMNCWPLFNTNLQELFRSYADYFLAFLPKAKANADQYLKNLGRSDIAPAGENGWIIATGCNPYNAPNASMVSHSGVGNGPLTALMFWDWYEFTQDKKLLQEVVYPILEGMSLFLSRTVADYDGKLLVSNSASPENANNRRTVGTAYDQQMIWENHYATQQAAKILGYTPEDHPVLGVIAQQIDKLDPVVIGASGQIKEYREENFYGEFGQPEHRHISQLVSVYPGILIASGSDVWKTAASKTLDLRGTGTTGWSVVHRQLCRARLEEAEKAYSCLRYFIQDRLMPNLWNDRFVFQVDGNFGYTAAVAEMLLQSHNGIRLLPALPPTWESGSFRGLTARGGFTVDVQWARNRLHSFCITSQCGGVCTVRYPGISQLQADAGISVVTEDCIRFETSKGCRYEFTLPG
jgi:hypothetical protein